jgi:hypothetical protein
MKKNILRALILLLAFCLIQESHDAFSAPDPAEVEEMKLQAPLHLIGKVQQDEFFQDVPNEEYLQTRKMTFSASEVLKAPGRLQNQTTFEIYYPYIPSWMAGEFVGPDRMDIAEGDLIEIWLEEGKDGWEPVLSGSTVNHLHYAAERVDPVKEPFIHKAERLGSDFFRNRIGLLVAIIFTALLLAIAVLARRHPKGKVF